MICVPGQSRGHSAHIGQDVIIHYRWHPLYGRSVRCVQSQRRTSGDVVHVELSADAVTILPAWKLDAVYCAGLRVGPPQVSLVSLCSLHELLIACESRLVSADGNIVKQETQDDSAITARTKDGACSEAEAKPPGGATPARPHSPRQTISAHDRGGAPSRAEGARAALIRGKRRGKAGGLR